MECNITMWNVISNVSSIVTCVAFLLYLAGHIWIVVKNRHALYEKLTVLPFDSKLDIEDEDIFLDVDTNGCEFTLQSDYGINSLKVYKIDNVKKENGTFNPISKQLKGSFENLKKDKLYIRCDLGETIPTTQFEIRRDDYTIITFDLVVSGKNGHIIACNFKPKLTVKGFLYHLCV